MNRTCVVVGLFFALALAPAAAKTAELTAVTLFGCDEQGTVDHAFRNNSGPIDAAWDVFLYEGDVLDPKSATPDSIAWLNRSQDHTVRIPLEPGRHTFTFHCEFSRAWPTVGMNLFLDDVHDQAAISVRAPVSNAGPPFPVFVANNARKTMGWPITDISAAGTLTCGGPRGGIYEFTTASTGMKVTLTSFRCCALPSTATWTLSGRTQSVPAAHRISWGSLCWRSSPWPPNPRTCWPGCRRLRG